MKRKRKRKRREEERKREAEPDRKRRATARGERLKECGGAAGQISQSGQVSQCQFPVPVGAPDWQFGSRRIPALFSSRCLLAMAEDRLA